MNRSPFPFRDFVRAKDNLVRAIVDPDEAYAVLTGDSGTGKTALLRELRTQLDRARHRALYFAEARRLGATGLVKVVGASLGLRMSMHHSVNLDRVLRAVTNESYTILLWIDEAHELPGETLGEVRALVESDLDGVRRVKLLLVGLPRLCTGLQAQPSLWRRITTREEITGLAFDEMQAFFDHHFAAPHNKRLCERGMTSLFERAKGAPGLLLPMYRAVLARAGASKGNVEPEQVEDALERWGLA